jgi:hypothetical protein
MRAASIGDPKGCSGIAVAELAFTVIVTDGEFNCQIEIELGPIPPDAPN